MTLEPWHRRALARVLKDHKGWDWEIIAGTNDKILLEEALDILLDCWKLQQKAGEE